MVAPNKKLGQHFLRDHTVIQRIIAGVRPHSDDCFVEIGPGEGVLTEPLLTQVKRLDVVEVDTRLVEVLQQRFSGQAALQIHHADALSFDFRALQQQVSQPLRVVGNLPYNISTPLLFHLIDQVDVIRDMHFMLQKEVVDRMVAAVGSSDYGRLSVMIQYYCDTDKLFVVRPGAFLPPPKVDSAVVRLQPYAELPHVAHDVQMFADLVRHAFGQRRKMIRKSLKAYFDEAAIAALGIDPQARPETLGVEAFVRLANAV